MGQDRKSDAGQYKHNNAEHPVWIVDRRTCSLVCFVLQCGPKRYRTLQLLRFSFVLDRIVHLPVPSERMRRCGKKIAEILSAEYEHNRAGATRRGVLQRKIKRMYPAKESAETREKSEVTMDATSPRRCALLTLTGVDYPPSCPASAGGARSMTAFS